ncbi:MAG: alpha/beta fold hydrolase, partial [Nocardioidaceae bacterium]
RPDLVRGLVLVSAVCDRSETERASVLERLRQSESDPRATVDAAVERWFTPQWRADEPGLVEQVRATLAGNDRGSYVACYRIFATADAEVWPHLAEIAAPTLAITGSDDPGSTPEMTHRLAAAIPKRTARIVEGARHLLPLQEPAALSDAILSHLEASHVAH